MMDAACNDKTTKAQPFMTFQEITDSAKNRRNVEAIFASEVKNYKERMKLSPERQLIWDYFFYSNYDNVGKYEKKLIKNLPLALSKHIQSRKNDYHKKLEQASCVLMEEKKKIAAKIKKISKIYAIIAFLSVMPFVLLGIEQVAGIIPRLAMLIRDLSGVSPLVIAACVAVGLIIFYSLTVNSVKSKIKKLEKNQEAESKKVSEEIEAETHKLETQCKNTIADLRSTITHLKTFIPKKPEDAKIIDILKA